MSMSRMLKLGEACRSRASLFQHHGCARKQNNYLIFDFKRCHKSASPFGQICLNPGSLNFGNLLKPFAFTILFSGGCLGGAAIWQYETMRSCAMNMLQTQGNYQQEKTGTFGKEVQDWWNSLSSGEKVFAPICLINVLVFAAWRVPKLQPVMLKYFCSNPAAASTCWPMLLSTFSHYSAFHLLANMYVLHSFSTGAVAALGKEQFLGLYLSAGVISSFTSYMYKVVSKQPGLSLGASGAIMAILGFVCTQYPDTKLGIILLPFLTFSAGSAIKVIVALDTAGVLLGWKIFDHAAHLGGAACGIAWAYWGNEHMWQRRDVFLQHWHDMRGQIK